MEQETVPDRRDSNVHVCPIDQVECEGANGPVGSTQCQKRCKAGLDFIESVTGQKALNHARWKQANGQGNKNGPKKGPEQHGVAWWGYKYKCKCDLCDPAVRAWRAEKARVRRASGKVKPRMRHGTRYSHDHRGCRCEECMDWNLQNNEKIRLRKQESRLRKSTEEIAKQHAKAKPTRSNRVHRGLDGTSEAEGNRITDQLAS